MAKRKRAPRPRKRKLTDLLPFPMLPDEELAALGVPLPAPPPPPPAPPAKPVEPHFSGATYEPKEDHARLTKQLERVRRLMLDSRERTLAEIQGHTGDPPASISARLRDLRKKRFGHFVVERRRDKTVRGLYYYRVLPREVST